MEIILKCHSLADGRTLVIDEGLPANTVVIRCDGKSFIGMQVIKGNTDAHLPNELNPSTK